MFEPSVTRPRDRGPLLRGVLGALLRRIRLEQERTLADVARDANISMQYLSEVERGLKEASSEVLAVLCDALGIDLSDLLASAGTELALAHLLPGTAVRLRDARDGRGPRQIGGLESGDIVCLAAA